MTDLPPGWEWTTLGELAAPEPRAITDGPFGSALTSSHYTTSGARVIRLQNIGDGHFFDDEAFISLDHFETLQAHELRQGDLLVASLGDNPPRACIAPELGGPAIVKADCIRVRPHPDLDPRFVLHSLISPSTKSFAKELIKGVSRPRLGLKAIRELPIPLAPLAEQRRIADEIEQHLGTTDRAARTVGSVRERSETLGEVSGRETLYPPTASPHAAPPTASFTGDGDLPSIPKEWSWQRLGDVAEVVGGVTKDSSKQSDPTVPLVPYLRVANVQRGRLELNEVAHIRATQRQVDKLTLRRGDVLLNEGGDRDKLGRGWVWEGQIEGCIHQNHVFRARVRDGVIHPKLLAWHANNFGHWFERNGKQSVNLASISLTTIKQLPVPVPPRELQQEMVASIESTLATCRRLQGAATDAIARAGALRASILRAAFAGELTHQDPTEEPAVVLLERIREEGAATPARRRSSRSLTR